MQVALVTNGYDLAAFLPRLAQGPVKEVQVTLDGPAPVHDRRRPHAGGGGTFERIVRGSTAWSRPASRSTSAWSPTAENLACAPGAGGASPPRAGGSTCPSLALQDPGRAELRALRLRLPPASGKTLFDRVELWARYVELSEAHPVLRRFHRPRFHGIGHLAETGELPGAQLRRLPGREDGVGLRAGRRPLTAAPPPSATPRTGSARFYPAIERDEAAIAALARAEHLHHPGLPGLRRSRRSAAAGAAPSPGDQAGTPLAPDCRPVPRSTGWARGTTGSLPRS